MTSSVLLSHKGSVIIGISYNRCLFWPIIEHLTRQHYHLNQLSKQRKLLYVLDA